MVESRLNRKTANETLLREHADYGEAEFFAESCEDDPTIRNRYELAKQVLSEQPVVQPEVAEQLRRAQQDTFDFNAKPVQPQPAPAVKPAPAKKKLKPALPKAPKQTAQQQLKATTTMTASSFATTLVYHRTQPSVKLTRNSKFHIDWSYYEDMLKLFAFIQLYKGELTPQQQLDKDTLTQAVERQGNARAGLRKRLNAAQLMVREVQTSRGARPYLAQGENVILALVKQEQSKVEKDPKKAEKYKKDSAALLRALDEITMESDNAWDQAQRRNITSMAHTVFHAVKDAYKQK